MKNHNFQPRTWDLSAREHTICGPLSLQGGGLSLLVEGFLRHGRQLLGTVLALDSIVTAILAIPASCNEGSTLLGGLLSQPADVLCGGKKRHGVREQAYRPSVEHEHLVGEGTNPAQNPVAAACHHLVNL